MTIPEIILEYAKYVGFDSITHLKTIGESEYYLLGYLDKSKNAQPTGLPYVIEYKGDDIEDVLSEELIWDLLT
jgi:hypothetical protein